MVVMVMMVWVDRLVHVRVICAAVLVERVTGVVVSRRRHPVQLRVQHVVGGRGQGQRRRRHVVRPVVLATAADDGRVHHHRYGGRRLLDRVMVGPDDVLIGRHAVRRQHGAAFPPEPPEPIARVHGQLMTADAAAAADTAVVAPADQAPDDAADSPAPADADAAVTGTAAARRPSRSGVLDGRRAVRAAGPPDDRAGAAVVQVVQMVQVVQVVQVMVVPRRYLGDLPLVVVQLLMVVMVVNSVRGRIERHQTLCAHNKTTTYNYYVCVYRYT